MNTFVHPVTRIALFTLAVLVFGSILCAQADPAATEGQSHSSGNVAPGVPAPAPDFQALTRQATSGSTQGVSRTAFQAIAYYLEAIQPNQGGIVWMAFLVTVMVAADFTGLRSRRNLDLALLLLPTFLFVDIIRFASDGAVSDPKKFFLAGIIFTGVFLATGAVAVRAVIGARWPSEAWTPNLPAAVLSAMLAVLLASNVLVAVNRTPDDCGIFTNIGAARMLETGKWPYGDVKLRDGAAATYGPVLYLAHMPFQAALSAAGWATTHDSRTGVPLPPVLATKLVALAFHLLLVGCLVIVGRKLGGPAVGFGLACLYAGSAYVQGLGGTTHFINGMGYVSHITPAALTLAALALIHRPFWSGVMLAVATCAIFFPAFFFPVFFGYYFWRGSWKGPEWRKFAAGFVLLCALTGSSVLLLTDSTAGESALHAVYQSTVGHQEGKHGYGSSAFSFWGTHPRLSAFWQEPFISNWYLLKPAFLLFAAFLASTFFLARERSVPQLACLIAAVAASIQLWKSHAGGTYVEWYLPFLLIGLFASSSTAAPPRQLAVSSESLDKESARVAI